MCVQTLLIWSCDHGRIPLRTHTCNKTKKNQTHTYIFKNNNRRHAYLGMSMGTHMILVPAPLKKYDTHAHLVPSWVSTMRVSMGMEVFMGNYQKSSTFKHPYIIHSKFHKSYIFHRKFMILT